MAWGSGFRVHMCQGLGSSFPFVAKILKRLWFWGHIDAVYYPVLCRDTQDHCLDYTETIA